MRLLLCLTLLFTAKFCAAQDFSLLPFTNHNTLQTVNATGAPTYPANGFPLKMRGVILNNPADMSNSTPNSIVQPFNTSVYWQTFVQSVDVNANGDFGGTAIYMAQNYGNIPPNLTFPGGVPTPDPTASYTNTEWQNQLNRVNNYAQNAPGTLPFAGYKLQAGDLVEIRSRGGLFFGGKFNVNEQHNKNADYTTNSLFSFDIIYLGHPGLPTPIHLQISDLWDNGTNSVKFDFTRASGGELYQGDYVSLDNVRLVSGQAASWNANALVTVEDSLNRQFKIQLGTNSLFNPANAPSSWFNATGIFNQEAGSSAPYTGGYQLWVMDPAAIVAVPEPSTVAAIMAGMLGWIALRRRKPASFLGFFKA